MHVSTFTPIQWSFAEGDLQWKRKAQPLTGALREPAKFVMRLLKTKTAGSTEEVAGAIVILIRL